VSRPVPDPSPSAPGETSSPPGNGHGTLDAGLRTALLAVISAAVVLTVVGAVWAGGSAAVGVACGGLLAAANLWIFAYIGRGILSGGRRKRIWALIAAVKVIALLAVVWLLIRSELVSGFALAMGYLALPIGAVVGTVVSPRPGDEPEERSGP